METRSTTPTARGAPGRVASLALVLSLVTGALSGCIIVPFGSGYGHGHHRHHHDRYYRY